MFGCKQAASVPTPHRVQIASKVRFAVSQSTHTHDIFVEEDSGGRIIIAFNKVLCDTLLFKVASHLLLQHIRHSLSLFGVVVVVVLP